MLTTALGDSCDDTAHITYMLRCMHVVVTSALVRRVSTELYPVYTALAYQYAAVKTKSPYFGVSAAAPAAGAAIVPMRPMCRPTDQNDDVRGRHGHCHVPVAVSSVWQSS